MYKILNFFKMKSKVISKDFLNLTNLFIISLILSFFNSYLIDKYLSDELLFNILDAISLTNWIFWLIINFILIAIIRGIILGIFTKIKFKKNYFLEIFIHVLKYCLLMMPFFILMIVITGNQIFIDNAPKQLNLDTYDFIKMKIISLISIISWLIIWIYYLNTSIKIFLERQYSKLIVIPVNFFISFLTISIVGYITIKSNMIDIKKYEEKIKQTYIKSIDDKYPLCKECKEKILKTPIK